MSRSGFGQMQSARRSCWPTSVASQTSKRRVIDDLRRVLDWYFECRYGRTEGPGTTPFYCDPTRVGSFAVSRRALASAEEPATFRLFVTLAMYQALRDVIIMRRQRSLPQANVERVAGLRAVRAFVASGQCPGSRQADWPKNYCDVWKRDDRVDCTRHPGLACDVKSATTTFNRMGDLGKLPASAYAVVWARGGLRELVARVVRMEPSPARRADLLVQHLEQVHRVGRKLATMFVSALSTPALAPGVSPWFPDVDGNMLVVVDTNVARAVDALRRGRGSKTYDARAAWIRNKATQLDLSKYDSRVPRHSPRLLQQALYTFTSRSNRAFLRDRCSPAGGICGTCVPRLCPFA